MNQCTFKQGLLDSVGPIIEGLHSENDRMVVTCAVMALLKYFNSNNCDDCLKSVTINGNTIIFTKKDDSTVDIQLPIDEFVTNAILDGNNLVLKRNQGQDLIVDLSNISTSVDTSKFFSRCEYNQETGVINFYNEAGQIKGTINLNLADTYINTGSLEQNQTNSHYVIKLNYNTSKTPISIDLNDFRDDIVNSFPFVPGYYWSASKPVNGRISTVPVYIGTDLRSTAPYDFGQHRYIVYSNDGVSYNLISEFKEPPVDKYILLSSYNDSIALNDSVSVPGGFLFLPFMKESGKDFNAHSLCITDLSTRTSNEIVTVNTNGQLSFISDSVLQNTYSQNSAFKELIDNMVVNTGLFPNSQYKLKIFYNKVFNVDTNYPDYNTYRLFQYPNAEKSVVDDPNGDEAIKAVVLQKSKLCNFINTDKRIESGDVTLPNMALRTNSLYTVEKEIVSENTTGYTINTLFQNNSNYYLLFGYQVIDTNNNSVPFANSNSSDNCFMYFSKQKYAPTSSLNTHDFVRDVFYFKNDVIPSQFKIYKKTYETDTTGQVKPESIIWRAVTDNSVVASDIMPNNGSQFSLTDLDNWVTDTTTATDATSTTSTANINNLNFIWSVFIGSLLFSKDLHDKSDMVPFTSDYLDTLGWNNKFKIYSVGASGTNVGNINIYVYNQEYNSTTKELESKCIVNFNITSHITQISGSVNLNIGTYNYLERNNEIYNFGAAPNLGDQYRQYDVVYPKVSINSIAASGYKFSNPNVIYKIK